jgi:hypothetical protein
MLIIGCSLNLQLICYGSDLMDLIQNFQCNLQGTLPSIWTKKFPQIVFECKAPYLFLEWTLLLWAVKNGV